MIPGPPKGQIRQIRWGVGVLGLLVPQHSHRFLVLPVALCQGSTARQPRRGYWGDHEVVLLRWTWGAVVASQALLSYQTLKFFRLWM